MLALQLIAPLRHEAPHLQGQPIRRSAHQSPGIITAITSPLPRPRRSDAPQAAPQGILENLSSFRNSKWKGRDRPVAIRGRIAPSIRGLRPPAGRPIEPEQQFLPDLRIARLLQRQAQVLLMALVAIGAQPAVASPLPPLGSVPQIDRKVLWAALAHETSQICPDLDLRKYKGMAYLWSIKREANALGYSDDQIRSYVQSKSEKARIRSLGEAYLQQRGFDPADVEDVCAFGRNEIARVSIIGSFLR